MLELARGPHRPQRQHLRTGKRTRRKTNEATRMVDEWPKMRHGYFLRQRKSLVSGDIHGKFNVYISEFVSLVWSCLTLHLLNLRQSLIYSTMSNCVCLCLTLSDSARLCMIMSDSISDSVRACIPLFLTMFDFVWLCLTLTLFDSVWLGQSLYHSLSGCLTMAESVWLCLTLLTLFDSV